MKVEAKKYYEYEIKTDEELVDLVPLGDFHFGNRECEEDKVRGYVDWLLSHPKAKTILMGDLLEGPNPHDKMSLKYPPQEQYEMIVDMFEPIAKNDQILGLHLGNHEGWVLKDSGINVASFLAKELNIPLFDYECFTKLKINSINYHIFSTHGSSGATTPSGKDNALRSMENGRSFDIGLMGHIHTKRFVPSNIVGISNKGGHIEIKKRFLVGTGHFLGRGGYSLRFNYRYEPIGAPRIQLFSKKFDIHISE